MFRFTLVEPHETTTTITGTRLLAADRPRDRTSSAGTVGPGAGAAAGQSSRDFITDSRDAFSRRAFVMSDTRRRVVPGHDGTHTLFHSGTPISSGPRSGNPGTDLGRVPINCPHVHNHPHGSMRARRSIGSELIRTGTRPLSF